MNKLLSKFLSPSKEEQHSETSDANQLTEIQKEIIRLVKKGSTSKEISLITGFTLDQINSERKALMKTMDCSNMYDVMLKLEKFNLS